MIFISHHPLATIDDMGFFPGFVSDRDPRPAREQINDNYRHGGGWSPIYMERWKLLDKERLVLKYVTPPEYPGDEGDPPIEPLCELRMRDERIIMYPHSVFAIFQPDGSFEVARCD
jgi:hypothetical protein